MTIIRSKKVMFDFIEELGLSYELFIALLILLLDVVIFIITLLKKRKNLSSVYEVIDSSIPFFIKKAEEQYPIGFGDIKKELVEKAVYGLLLDKFNITTYSKYKDYIDKSIELILSTPQKKGEVNEKKKS